MRTVVFAYALGAMLAGAETNSRPAAERSRCGGCHIQSRLLEQSPMAATLGRAASSRPLHDHPDLKFSAGGYDYRIQFTDAKPLYTVSGGGKSVRAPLEWFFGSARTGQTYVFQIDGVMYESRVSYYPAINGLDLTIGAAESKPKGVLEAAGREMPPDTVRQCFGCHGSGAHGERLVSLDGMIPGVSCENCHGSAEAHINRTGSPRSFKRTSADGINELCGRCHRTWVDVVSMGIRALPSVRFQPYRFMNSRCYNAEDTRLRCTSCHDPHRPQDMSVAKMDATCLSCHGVKTCPKGTGNCASCHMPKYEIPGSHGMFTDHMIRVVKAGEKLPD